MKSRNKDLEKEKKNAEHLESILNNVENHEEKKQSLFDRNPLDEILKDDNLPEIKEKSVHVNFQNLGEEVENEAKEVLHSVIKFYVDQKYINEKDYVQAKQKVDQMTLSAILFQIKTAQYAIVKLLEEIDLGNTHPRVFESLAQLQAQMMNIVKHQATYMVALQEGYKQINQDSHSISPKELTESTEAEILEPDSTTGVKTRGTKDLMKSLDNIEDIKSESERESLTDAKNRPEAPEYAKDQGKDDDQKNYEIDEDLF